MAPPKKPVLERFWARVQPEPNTGCWLWTGPPNSLAPGNLPYGSLRIDGKNEHAHRIAFRLFVGDIPPGVFVLHRCDVAECVNPEHLYLGTQADNMRDRRVRGGVWAGPGNGERNHLSKLKADEVLAIRAADGCVSRQELSRQYRVTPGHIKAIQERTTWRHL